MTTIGGYAFRLLDRLPQEGDRVESEDIMIQIMEMDDHRIARVRVAKGLDEEEFEEADEIISAESELESDPRAEDRDELEEIPEDIDEEMEIESEDHTERMEESR